MISLRAAWREANIKEREARWGFCNDKVPDSEAANTGKKCYAGWSGDGD